MTASSVSPATTTPRTERGLNWNVILLLLVGLASLVIAEQIATGWLTLGDRLNISRRDFNLLEIVVMVGAAIWGLLCLWTLIGFLRHEKVPGVRRYFESDTPMPPGVRLSVVLLAIISGICLLVAVQVFTGWLPLGERTNISRRDLNTLEWLTIVISAVAGLLTLRTVMGFLRRDWRAWAYAQWVLLLTAAGSAALFVWGFFRIQTVLPRGSLFWNNLGGVQELTAPGLLVLLSSVVAYRYLTAELDTRFTRQQTAPASLEDRARARDTSGMTGPALQAIRNRLSRSPGAGAIIAFIAIFVVAAVSPASDNFLTPAAQASWLTTNTINGVIAIGVTMLMISGEFDLSVGSMLGVSGLTFLGLITGQLPMIFIFIVTLIAGWLAFVYGLNSLRRGRRSLMVLLSFLAGALFLVGDGWLLLQSIGGTLPEYLPQLPPVLAAIVSLGFTMFLGFVNGTILIRTGIPSFIVTLGTLLAFRAVPLLLVADGRILRYADYFGNQPPIIDINRGIVLVVALLLAAGFGFLAFTVIRSHWSSLRQRWSTYASDPNPFRDLALVANGALFLFSTVISLAVLYLLVGGGLDQLDKLDAPLSVSFFDLMNGRIETLPFVGQLPREINFRIGVLWWFVLVMIFQFILTQTRFGNSIFAVGGNPGAARAQGINVDRVKVTNFVLLALLVGIAAIFDVSRVQSVDALRGSGLELEVIAASVIGGALLTGGYGSVFGALLGVFIFGILQTILVLNSINPRVFNGVIGIILIVAVVINEFISRRTR